MYLAIDNTENGKLIFFLSTQGSWREYTFEVEAEGALLSKLEEVLAAAKITLEDLRGIAVRVGVGRFTATRVAVTVANTLAYALKIPVIAETNWDTATLLQQLEQAHVGTYAHARYSAEPRLGPKKP